MSAAWARLDFDSIPLLEDALSEQQFLQLRYLSCACVANKISNDHTYMSIITYNVLKQWGFRDVRIVPALKRVRYVENMSEAQNFFDPKLIEEDTNKVEAMMAFVCIVPTRISDPQMPDRKILYPAITDLYQTPDLSLPIYCMQRRNALSPLSMVPLPKVYQYALMHDDTNPITQSIRSKMTLDQRRILDDTASSLASSHPGERILQRIPAERRQTIESIIRLFSTPYTEATRPSQEFFKYFATSMEKVKEVADFDPATNTIKLKSEKVIEATKTDP